MCQKVGVYNPQHSVDIFLTDEERMFAQEKIKAFSHPIFTVHTTPGDFDRGRKMWPVKYWQRLVSMLTDRGYTVIQLGTVSEYHIEKTTNMLGTQDIRRSIALIQAADLHIGVVSSLMHGAAAVGTPAVILFGGFERFSIHDYSTVHPFESHIPCSPCIQANTKMEKCPLQTQCMREITPEKVYRKVLELTQKNRDTAGKK